MIAPVLFGIWLARFRPLEQPDAHAEVHPAAYVLGACATCRPGLFLVEVVVFAAFGLGGVRLPHWGAALVETLVRKLTYGR